MIGFNEVKGCTVINPLQPCFYTWLHLNFINCSFWFIKVVCYSLFDFFYFLVVHYLIMGNSIDCCFDTRQHNQCFFPFIRSCSLGESDWNLKAWKGCDLKVSEVSSGHQYRQRNSEALALGKVSLHINLKWYDNTIILMLRIAFHKPVESS